MVLLEIISKCRRPARRFFPGEERTFREAAGRVLEDDGNRAPTLHSPFETGSDTGRFR